MEGIFIFIPSLKKRKIVRIFFSISIIMISKSAHSPPKECLFSDAQGITWHLITWLLCTHPYCTAWELLLALSEAYWLWLHRKLKRTGSTWTGFPSTLLLQLLFDCKINDRIRTEGSWLDVKLELALGSGPSRFTLCLRACVQKPRNAVLPVCAKSGIAAFSVSQYNCVLTARNCALTLAHNVQAPPLLHHLHAHTYTHTHPAYWRVTMETERLLPNRGGDGDSRREEDVYLDSSMTSWINHINNWTDTF